MEYRKTKYAKVLKFAEFVNQNEAIVNGKYLNIEIEESDDELLQRLVTPKEKEPEVETPAQHINKQVADLSKPLDAK